MPLTPGARVGTYEVVSALGAGGMGEVYLARDTRLGRSVAIKILPEAFASDPERIARFEREAKVLASLNHPHIAVLHGMEDVDGQHVLVMELVEGETLAEQLARGPIAPGGALAIGIQIAAALEAAHEKGIVHRDLKPANVKITPAGSAKVLDFGLARAMLSDSPAPNISNSPTFHVLATGAGVILGTAGYMAPEQAKGLPADHRSDIFSFGILLYEMVTARSPFRGETATDLLASILARDPELGGLDPHVHPRLLELVRRCLEKDPKRRWQAIADVRLELEAIAAAPRFETATGLHESRRPRWQPILAATAAVVVAAAAGAAGGWYWRPSQPAAVARFSVPLAEGQRFTGQRDHLLAISADGSRIVFAADGRLYLRSVASHDIAAVQGTDGYLTAFSPVFSPDGESIAFAGNADRTLKRVPVRGGAPVTLCQLDEMPYGVSWGPKGIVVSQVNRILLVSPNGGTPVELARVVAAAGERLHGPELLPGGDALLFTVASSTGPASWDQAHIVVQSLRSGTRKMLIERGSDAHYVRSGHLVYALGGTLFAVAFDVERLEVVGDAVPVLEGVQRSASGSILSGAAQFSVSDTGTLVYIPGPSTAATLLDLAIVSRQGTVKPLSLPPGPYESPRMSPDGTRVAFDADDGKEAAIYVSELSGAAAPQRITFRGRNRYPVWTADSRQIVFQSTRDGAPAIFRQNADGTGAVERLTNPAPGEAHVPESWSPNGETLLFSVNKDGRMTLWTYTARTRTVARFNAVESSTPTDALFSPDGRWVAYSATEERPSTVFVEPFPPTGTKYELPRNRDVPHHHLWSPAGDELIYNPRPGGFEVVPVRTRPTFSFGPPIALARTFQAGPPSARRDYDMTPGGEILALVPPGGSTKIPMEIRVVLNWFQEVASKAPRR